MDVSIMIGDIKFNYRVATIIKNENKILLHKNKNDDFYAIPGGRIMIGEDSISSLKRELKEEIGVNLDIKKYLGTIENFFEYTGKKYHEVMIVYEGEFNENKELYEKEKIVGLEKDSDLEFIWKTIDEIKDIDLRPKFLKDSIVNNSEVTHLINKMI